MSQKKKSIGIIGAGPSGISAYIEIIRLMHDQLDSIVLFDPNGVMNSFSFNSTLDTTITNTSIGVNSVTCNSQLDFYNWLRDKTEHKKISASDFVPRKTVKDYFIARFKQARDFAQAFGCKTMLVENTVAECTHHKKTFTVKSALGENYEFDAVILASGVEINNPMPLLSDSNDYIVNPYPENNYLNRLNAACKHVVILGSKLSAIDTAIAVHNQNPNIKITMVSKSAQLPRVRDYLLINNSLAPLTNKENKNIESFAAATEQLLKLTSKEQR